MKRFLQLLVLAIPPLIFGQTNVQKGAGNVLSNGSIVVGNSTSITATGTGSIISTGGVASSMPYTGITLVPTSTLLGRTTAATGAAEALTVGTSLSLSAGTLNAIQDIRTSASPTFAGLTLTAPLTGANGGTGVANAGKTITLGGNFTTSGAFGLTFTIGALTNVTLPSTGTLATLAGAEALTNKTYNGNTWTAGTGTLTIAAGKTLTQSNTLTYTGTDGSSVAFGTGGTVLYSGGAYVSSLAGTANQITASGSMGAVTLSIPSTFIAPGSIAATTGVSGTTGTFSTLTSGRVPFASTAGLLIDDSDMTFVTDTLTVTKAIHPTSLLVGASTGLQSNFTVIDTGVSLPRGISNVQVSSATDSANISGYKARGTVGSETTIVTGDLLTNFRSWGHDGTTYINSGSIIVRSSGTIATSRVPSQMEFWTSTNAAPSVLTLAGTISSSQLWTLTNSLTMAGTLTGAATLTGTNTVTSASATNLTLTGNGGASLVLGQGGSGNITATIPGGQFLLPTGSIGTPSLSFGAGGGAGFYRISNGVAAVDSGAEIWRTSSGSQLIVTGTGGMNVNSTVASTSTTTGSGVFAGGIGVAAKIFAGSDITMDASNSYFNVSSNRVLLGDTTSNAYTLQVATQFSKTSSPATYFTFGRNSLATISNQDFFAAGRVDIGQGSIGTISSYVRIRPAAFSQSSWTTDGVLMRGDVVTVTDSSTAGSGTAASAVFYSFAAPGLAATNTLVTTTNAATVYISGGPTVSTNQTLTYRSGLWNAGNTLLDGDLMFGSSTRNARFTRFGSGSIALDGVGLTSARFDLMESGTSTGSFETSTGNLFISTRASGKAITFRSGNATTALTLDGSTQAATFTGPITQNVASSTQLTVHSTSGTGNQAIIELSNTAQSWNVKNAGDSFQIRDGTNAFTAFQIDVGAAGASVARLLGTVASTSTTTGSGIFSGGIGVAGAGWFGSTLNTAGGLSVTGGNGSFIRGGGAHNDVTVQNTSSGGDTRMILSNDGSNALELAAYGSTFSTSESAVAGSFRIGMIGASPGNIHYWSYGGTHKFWVSGGPQVAVATITSTALTALQTTEATIGGAGGIVASGGIYAAKKLITASTITTAAGVTWDVGAYNTGGSGLVLQTTKYVTAVVGGTTVKLAVVE